MAIQWSHKEIDDFRTFLENVRNGTIKHEPFVLQPEEKLNNPKIFEEIAEKASELPSDDSITWAKVSKCGEYYMNPLFLDKLEHLNIKFKKIIIIITQRKNILLN